MPALCRPQLPEATLGHSRLPAERLGLGRGTGAIWLCAAGPSALQKSRGPAGLCSLGLGVAGQPQPYLISPADPPETPGKEQASPHPRVPHVRLG